MRTTEEQRFYDVFSPMIPFHTPCEQQKSSDFTTFSAYWSLFIIHVSNRRAEVLQYFQGNHSFPCPMRPTEEQRFYNVFKSMIPFYIPCKQQKSRDFINVFMLKKGIFYISCEQQKSRHFIMFSAHWSLFILHINNTRAEVLQYFQGNHSFPYPMQTTEEKRFYYVFKPMILFYIPCKQQKSRSFINVFRSMTPFYIPCEQ